MVERDVLDAAARRIAREDRHPVRPHPDQRHAHPPRADDRDDPRLRARGGVHPPGRGEGRRGGRRGERPAQPGDVPVPARRGVVGRAGTAACSSRDGTIYWVGSHGRRRPADRPVRPRAAGPGVPPPRRSARGRPVQPLDPHDRHASPGGPLARFYGLAAQELEKETGRDVPLLRGGFGLDPQPRPEGRRGRLFRIKEAVADAAGAGPRAGPSTGSPRPARRSSSRSATFDEAKADAASRRLLHQADPRPQGRTRRRSRSSATCGKDLAPRQGEVRKTWVQAIVDRRRRARGRPGRVLHGAGPGDQAPLALSVYLRLRAGQRLCRLHPRRPGFDRGGYQVWTGLHSFLERGSGETIVDEAVRLLDRLHAGASRSDFQVKRSPRISESALDRVKYPVESREDLPADSIRELGAIVMTWQGGGPPVVGVDLGGTKILAGVVGADNRILGAPSATPRPRKGGRRFSRRWSSASTRPWHRAGVRRERHRGGGHRLARPARRRDRRDPLQRQPERQELPARPGALPPSSTARSWCRTTSASAATASSASARGGAIAT